MHQNKNALANALEKYRRRIGLPQRRVATLLGHRDSTSLSAFERGRRMPPLITALRLGIILRVPIEFLFPNLYSELRDQIRAQEEKLGGSGRGGADP